MIHLTRNSGVNESEIQEYFTQVSWPCGHKVNKVTLCYVLTTRKFFNRFPLNDSKLADYVVEVKFTITEDC